MRMGRLLTFVSAALLASCAAPEERDDIAYDERYDDTKLDLYLPTGDGARPTVMLIHGGAWAYGGRYLMTPTARRLANSGYVVANIAYRLSAEGAFPENIRDAWCALSFLRAHASEFRIDPERIAVLGYSAGGHAAAMLGTAPNDASLQPDCASGKTAPPRAVIAGAPVVDMRSFSDSPFVLDYMGGRPRDRAEAYDLASPIRHVRAGLPPFLFVAGGGDWWVGEDDIRAMNDAMRAAGNDTRLLEVGGGGHVLSPVAAGELVWTHATETPEAWLAIQDFLGRTIGKP
jgi:acetyl esterase/lipase